MRTGLAADSDVKEADEKAPHYTRLLSFPITGVTGPDHGQALSMPPLQRHARLLGTIE